MWRKFSEVKPKPGVPVVWKGESGYMAPNVIQLVTGTWEPGFRRWPIAIGGNAVEPTPEYWCYMSEVETALSLLQEANRVP